MFTSLLQIADFIRARKVKKDKILDITNLQEFGEVAWNFLSSIYEAGWDSIPIDNCNTSFRNTIMAKLNFKLLKSNNSSLSDKFKERESRNCQTSFPHICALA